MERLSRIRVARARAWPRTGDDRPAFDHPELFGRQGSSDCTGGTDFYLCAMGSFSGCCSVDPCSMKEGCPDDDRGGKKETDGPAGTSRTPRKTTDAELPTGVPTPAFTTTVYGTPIDRDSLIPTHLDNIPDEDDDGGEDEDENRNGDSGDVGGGGGDIDDRELPSGRKGVSPGGMAGIILGILTAIFILIALACMYRRRRRKVTAARAIDVLPPPMDANDEKFLRAMEPSSAVTATTTSTLTTNQPADYGEVFAAADASSSSGNFPSSAPTPSAIAYSHADSTTAAAAASSFSGTTLAPPAFAHHPRGGKPPTTLALAEMDSVDSMRPSELPAFESIPPSELPASTRHPSELPAGPPAPARAQQGGDDVLQAGGNREGLATVAESKPRSAGGLRGTLNPTDGERSRQTYVTSWSQFERGSR